MSIIEGLIGPIAKLVDKIIPDPEARDRAKLELLKIEGSQEMEAIRIRMTAIVAEANSVDPWTSRARPSFLYVMYTLLLWATDGPDRCGAARDGEGHCRGDECLSRRDSRTALRALWHGVSGLQRGEGVGEGEGGGELTDTVAPAKAGAAASLAPEFLASPAFAGGDGYSSTTLARFANDDFNPAS